MHKFWLVAKQEYLKRTAKRSFILGTLAIPLLIVIVIAVIIFVVERNKDTNPIGYVDYSGILSERIAPEPDDDSVEVVAFDDEESAMAALENGDIQGYYVIPNTYPEVLEVDLYYMDDWIDTSVQVDFDDYIRANVLPEGPNEIQHRLIEGPELTVQSADGEREFGGEAGFIVLLFPWIVAMFFFFTIMGASGYFLQAITDEKENRTMEIMVTSVSPEQLISGKAIGLLAVGLTQIGVWILTIVIGWFVAQNFIEEIQGIVIPWDVLLVFIAYFLPSYALVAGMMLGIGGLVSEYQEGQQISGVLNLLFTFPLFMSVLIFANPNNPILIFLSFFPTTSFITITMRWGFTVIPFWQLVLSWLILVATATFLVWVAARIFRLGMLRYGQRLKLKSTLATIRAELSN